MDRQSIISVVIKKLSLVFALLLIATSSTTANLLDQLGLGKSEKPPLLKPEQAFIYSPKVIDDHTLMAQINIVEGYYLYRDKFAFKILDSQGIDITDISLPEGKTKKDPFMGVAEVYPGKIEIQIPIKLNRQNLEAEEITLESSFQGCSAIHGICYPPITEKTLLELPLSANREIKTTDTENPSLTIEKTFDPTSAFSDQDRIAQSLFHNQGWFTLVAFFGFGLLLSFTPCVFPMIPILSGIIVGQGKHITTKRSFILSLAYVLAMALTYTVVGVIAGLVGNNLQATFQHPAILMSASLVFVLLALSMFDLYQLQMPLYIQNRLNLLSQKQKGGTLLGSGLMGLFSALIVGPCVAPPLAGALIYIGESGNALLGGSALFSLSIGMGTPLLILGTSGGKLLPKAGPWLQPIKYFFGVLLLVVAIWLLSRILPHPLIMLLWGALFLISAVYLGALEVLKANVNGWRKFRKGIGLISLVYGILLIIGAASGEGTEWQPLKGLTAGISGTVISSNPRESIQFQSVKGIDELQVALDQYKDRYIILDFYADWCVDCKRMEVTTFQDPKVITALKNIVLLQTDVTDYDDKDKALLKQFSLYGPPSILFFTPTGTELKQYRIIGIASPKQFLSQLRQVIYQTNQKI
ncbi:protein-disulfide reductase DsbD [Candidatus Nitrosacidococcus tergens]|uniref:Thiol:disulfide interchange protein DsbD n=1 Tax=Candidatus Nitrosacidococcus tergens TaxID=553981 RepID=A0A7G1QBG0_9GAMM|nr:protein-disulfide reductase DsbD [Candidatus Nitrosacidococcus tergens]CAB1277189.1 Thiol:disulfide interchange protein DsbD [Candidatus Nitrosacidococcus tergens]